jgi:hypothetical protein
MAPAVSYLVPLFVPVVNEWSICSEKKVVNGWNKEAWARAVVSSRIPVVKPAAIFLVKGTSPT